VNILIISQYFWPESFRINDLVEGLILKGHNVTILTGYPNYPYGDVFEDFLQNPGRYDQYKGGRIVRVPLLPRKKGGVRLALNYISYFISASILGPWMLRNVKFDVIFVYEPSPITVGIPAIVLKKIKKAPVLFWVLDLWPETPVALGALRSKVLISLVGSLARYIYNRCDLVLGQSMGFVEQIKKYCDNEDKVKFFPSWAEDAHLNDCELLAPEVQYIEGVFNILFAGNIGDAQDFPAIIDAAEFLAEYPVRWIIVGDGRLKDDVINEVRKRSLINKFVFVGSVPVERLASFYEHSQAALISLKADEFLSLTIPGKVQSCLLSGLPIIGMLDGESASIIQEAEAGIVCAAGDSIGLASAVQSMVEMTQEERDILGGNGKRYVDNNFDRIELINYLESMMKESLVD